MAPGTDDPKDLGSKKIFNQEKPGEKNEGFSGENLPKNYDPSADKLKMELEKNEEGELKTEKRARDVDEKQAPPVNSLSGDTQSDGALISKSRGTETDAEDMETAKNRDFNSDLDEDRYPTDHPDNKRSRGNIDFGNSEGSGK
jgi:hypothetical protein